MKVIFLTALLYFFNVQINDFENFKNSFPEVKLPLNVNDSIAFEKWPTADLIKLKFVEKYKLIEQYKNKTYSLHNLKDYKCSYFGRYVCGDNVALLYKTFTTGAGRGNPKIILEVFSRNGKKKDEAIVLWDDVQDPLYSQKITLTIPTPDRLSIKCVRKISGYLDGKIVPKRITEELLNYIVTKFGKVKIKGKSSKVIFIDKNPKIKDDFPQQ